MPPSSNAPVAYGLRINGLDESAPLCPHPDEPPWPELTLRHEPTAVSDVEPYIGETEFLIPMKTGGALHLDAPRGVATFRTPERPDDDVLLHPHLASCAAGRNRTLGRDVFHAGAFLVGDRAWAVAGTNEAGKSTLMATLNALGCAVLSDDVTVMAEGAAFAGPRVLDLRQPDAPGGAATVPARGGTRWRLRLGDAPARAPLDGFIHLGWGDAPSLAPMAPGERLDRLARLRRWPFLPADPHDVLDLATLPTYTFTRTRDRAALLPDATWLLAQLARRPPGSG